MAVVFEEVKGEGAKSGSGDVCNLDDVVNDDTTYDWIYASKHDARWPHGFAGKGAGRASATA
ncbi:hypothetical protein [Arvimicrobium flavum]|uniref:hypothetical protein n=1 Tax=Arvimicrobium flavum TaxID=3393320 RepID=UPI00237B3E32|nr:hypothetical protein [Mesorhizobium shangrilense]